MVAVAYGLIACSVVILLLIALCVVWWWRFTYLLFDDWLCWLGLYGFVSCFGLLVWLIRFGFSVVWDV